MKRFKVQEGNYIDVFGIVKVVTGFTSSVVYCKTLQEAPCEEETVLWINVKPIELNEKWLKSFDCNYSCDTYNFKNDDFLFSIELSDSVIPRLYTEFYGGDIWQKEIPYVHQLQQLFELLTSKEPTIK